MKKILIPCLAVVLLLTSLFLPTLAASTMPSVDPSLSIRNGTVTCDVLVTAAQESDPIYVTVYLLKNGIPEYMWSASGTGYLRLEESVPEEPGQGYSLDVIATVNEITVTGLPVSYFRPVPGVSHGPIDPYLEVCPNCGSSELDVTSSLSTEFSFATVYLEPGHTHHFKRLYCSYYCYSCKFVRQSWTNRLGEFCSLNSGASQEPLQWFTEGD